MDGSEAELDRREISDAQRSKRESTSSPIPCKETEIGGRLKGISPVCQDLLTDPYLVPDPDVDLIGAFIVTILIWLTSR